MPRGFAATAEGRQGDPRTGGSYAQLYFKIDDGESAVIRFLEQGEEVGGAWFHKTNPGDGSQWGRRVICLDQDDETGSRIGADCPGCEQALPRSWRGLFNVIWRDAPVFERTSDNKVVKEGGKPKVVGQKDQVALWDTSQDVYDDLGVVDAKYKGLTSRDFEVVRRGSHFDTAYNIVPADVDGGVKPLSKADEKLAQEKNDLNEFLAKPAYDAWNRQSGGGGGNSGGVSAPAETSPFMRGRQ